MGSKKGFVAHRDHQGVDDEKGNEEPWRTGATLSAAPQGAGITHADGSQYGSYDEQKIVSGA